MGTARQTNSQPTADINEALAALAQSDLLEFIRQTKPDFVAGWFQSVICKALEQFLEDVKEKRSPRYAIFAPPRHSKSEMVSRRFPAWAFGRHPELTIIGASHNATLAAKMNRDVQRVIDSPEYQAIFPDTKLSGKNVRSASDQNWLRNTEEFEIVDNEGSYRAAAVRGGISGFGADAFIIDDPIRNKADASSKTVRESIYDWYTNDALTRLSPGGGILLMHTRWHEDDLAGRLLEKMKEPGSEQFKVFRFPALAEKDERWRNKGDALHPERYSRKALLRIKSAMIPRDFEALYQQSPRIAEGSFFKKQWFEIVDAVPTTVRRSVRYWDLAATVEAPGKDPDWTVGVKLGITDDRTIYFLDVIRFRGSPNAVRTAMRNGATQDGYSTAVAFEQEPGASGKADANDKIRKLQGFRVKAVKSDRSKEIRAAPLADQAEAGNVKILRAAWNAAFIDELIAFPNGKHDDQVDAASGAFIEITNGLAFDDPYGGESVASDEEQLSDVL